MLEHQEKYKKLQEVKFPLTNKYEIKMRMTSPCRNENRHKYLGPQKLSIS